MDLSPFPSFTGQTMVSHKRIDKVVANYEVWLDDDFPFAKMKVKVLQRADDDFLAVSNLNVRNSLTRDIEFIAGLGTTPDIALTDLLHRFCDLVREQLSHGPLGEEDFVWSASEEF